MGVTPVGISNLGGRFLFNGGEIGLPVGNAATFTSPVGTSKLTLEVEMGKMGKMGSLPPMGESSNRSLSRSATLINSSVMETRETG
jgi:hypothetical protein